VKDQYVGDINDFEKYAILRALQGVSQLSLVVCWMLTAPDETGEGAKIDYLGKVSRYRHLDPHAFDCLAAVVRSGERSTRAIEAVGVLEGAHFVSNRLGDDHGSRAALFDSAVGRSNAAVAAVLRPRHRSRRQERPQGRPPLGDVPLPRRAR
jgi:hypothetical protein